jgi:hypothetical protein
MSAKINLYICTNEAQQFKTIHRRVQNALILDPCV